MGIDIKKLKSSVNIVDIIGQYVPLKKDGYEYITCCPFHGEKTPSLKVNEKKQIFHCFGCGLGTDVIDFLTEWGYSFDEAIEILKGNSVSDPGALKKRHVEQAQNVIDWKLSDRAPEHQPTDFTHYKLGKPVAVWPYRNEQGLIVSYDCRFERRVSPDKVNKDVLPFTWCTDGERHEWRWKAMGSALGSRLPYNADKLKKFPNKPVILVEGRKSAEAAERIAGGKSIISTWQGGGKAVDKTDWSLLKGRKYVAIWQDNDFAGYQTSLLLTELISPLVEAVKYIHNPPNKEKGWDVADAEAEGWNKQSTSVFINANLFDYPQEIDKENKIVSNGNEANGKKPVLSAGVGSIPSVEAPSGVVDVPGSEVSQHRDNGSELQSSGVNGGNGISEAGDGQSNSGGPAGGAARVNDASAPEGVTLPVGNVVQNNRAGKGLPGAPGSVSRNVGGQEGSGPRPPAASDGASEMPDGARNQYFRFLGFQSNDGKISHCFFNNTNKTIIKLSASGMSKPANLLELAPLYFWQQHHPNKRDGIDHVGAVNFLLSVSNRMGVFRSDKIRGRGAWIEDGKVVVHSGDYLVVNNRYVQLSDHYSKHIYEQGAPLNVEVKNSVDTERAKKLLNVTKKLRWEREVNAHLLAGWCVVAPMCGALKWRPHIWITGSAGCGKTWVMNSIVKHLLGDMSLCVQGATSEAGIRQALRRDALPVVFDEAEGEDKQAQDRMQSILTLMRSSSAEDGGNIVKGSPSSGSEAFMPRSCYAYASIGMQAQQQSDRTRITVLGMRNYDGDEETIKRLRNDHFQELLTAYEDIMSEDFASGLRARTIRLLPVILDNIKVFSQAAAVVLGAQRAGDQLGALLAGAWSLVSEERVGVDAAIKWIKEKDWTEEMSLVETRDEHRLFAHIMEQVLRAEGQFSTFDRSVGELIALRIGKNKSGDDGHITGTSADMSLLRAGIRVECTAGVPGGRILFSNTSAFIKKSLKETPWARNWQTILIRINGARKEGSTRFGSFYNARAISIPLEYFYE